MDEIYALERAIRQLNYTHLLSIGGGRVGDFAKRLALLTNLRLLIIPTIIANDGLISPVAVLRDETHSVAGRMPDAIFLDLDILKRAPAQYLVAAVPVDNQIRKYWWCSPPRIGRQRICPARSTARENGASFSKERCVRMPL